jgi:hypothetical protein
VRSARTGGASRVTLACDVTYHSVVGIEHDVRDHRHRETEGASLKMRRSGSGEVK